MRYIFSVVAALLLAACSGESHERYVGLWKQDGVERPTVLSISKEDSKTYLLDMNILVEKDPYGNKKTGNVLTLGDKGEVGINNGLMLIPFVLSENGKTLRIDNKAYTRISESEYEKFKTDLAQNEQLCKKLKTEYDAAYDSLVKESPKWGASAAEHEQWSKQRDNLRKQYREEKAKQIPYCRI